MNADRIVSFSAMLVGVATLGIVVYQTQLEREAKRAEVLPYVTMSLMANGEATYIVVRNAGVGPALLEDVRIHYHGDELNVDPYDFYIAERGTTLGANLSVDKLIPGRLISPGEVIRTLGWEGQGAREMVRELLSVFDIGEVPDTWYTANGVVRSGPDKAIIEITYTSVYGERWRVSSDKVVPERVD